MSDTKPDAPPLVEILKRLAMHRDGLYESGYGSVRLCNQLSSMDREFREALEADDYETASRRLESMVRAAGVQNSSPSHSPKEMHGRLRAVMDSRVSTMAAGDRSFDAGYADFGPEAAEMCEIWKRLGEEPGSREDRQAYWHHPLVRACEWLEERVGISRHDLEHAAFRLTTPLGLKGMESLPSPDGDLLTAQEEKAKRELCELYDLMAADKTPPEVKGQGKPVQLTEKQLAALAGLRPKCFQVISEEQAEALAQLPGRAVKRKRPSEGDPGMPDWLWMTAKFRELDLDGTTDRDSTTARLWRWLAKEYPVILKEAGIPVETQAPAAKPPEAADGGEHPPQSLAPLPVPKQLLTNWREILVALGMTNNDEDRQKVDGLNKSFNGPIVKPGQGRQPFANERKLLEWWNGLEEMVQAQANWARDTKETVKGTHAYGREGEVVPEISGEVKKRRKDRQP